MKNHTRVINGYEYPNPLIRACEHWAINQFLGGEIPEDATVKSLYRELRGDDDFDWYFWQPFEGMNEREVFENILHMRNSLLELIFSVQPFIFINGVR